MGGGQRGKTERELGFNFGVTMFILLRVLRRATKGDDSSAELGLLIF